jgi:ferric-dicitrate binding protein FerR (iron transport regulator)
MTSQSARGVPYSADQIREATDWFVVIHDGANLNADTLQRWSRWVDAAPGNRLAFEAISRTWHRVPTSCELFMPTPDELAADEYDADQPVDEWLVRGTPPQPHAAPLAGARVRSGGWWPNTWAIAAAITAALVGLYAMSQFIRVTARHADEFVTRTGEQMEVTLDDGSHVWLGAKSRLSVAFTRQQRAVRLDSGEAFFSVRKDRSRPFTVHASSGDITAVGTAFNVREVADRVIVTVAEGVVKVSQEAQPDTTALIAVNVTSGQQLVLNAQVGAHRLPITQTENPGERARWREGVLVYRDEPLRDVVADVARYSELQLEVTEAVADLHFSGAVYKNAIDEWTRALPESFPVKVVAEGNRVTIMAR